MRTVVLAAIGIACLVVLVLPRRRAAIARKFAESRRFVSRRVVDEEARAASRAVDTWDNEGGAARPAIESPRR